MKPCNQCGKYCLQYSDVGLSATAEEIQSREIFNPAIADIDASKEAQITLDHLVADSRPPLS